MVKPAGSGTGGWQIRYRSEDRKKVILDLGVSTPEAARHIYVQWEIDRRAIEAKYKEIGQANTRTVLEALSKYYHHTDGGRPRDATISGRKNALSSLAKAHGNKLLISVTAPMLHELIRARSMSVSHNSVCKERRQLRAFFGWCVRREFLRTSPAHSIHIGRFQPASEARRRLVTAEELKTVMVKMPEEWEKHALFLLWSLGVSPVDLWRLRPDSVSLGAKTVNLVRRKTSKGDGEHGKIVSIPVGQRILPSLIWWTSQDRSQFRHHLLSRHLKSVCIITGTRPFTVAALRHSRITLWLREGCQVYDVMRWAGHRRIDQTMEYMEEADKAVRLPQEPEIEV